MTQDPYDAVRRVRFRRVIHRRAPGSGNYDTPFPADIERWYQTWLLLCADSFGSAGRPSISPSIAAELTRLAKHHREGWIVLANGSVSHIVDPLVINELIQHPGVIRIIPIVNGD